MKLFFVLIVLLIVAAQIYLGFGWWRLLPGKVWIKGSLILMSVGLTLLLIADFRWGEQWQVPVTTFAHRLTTSWLFIFVYMVMLMLVVDGLRRVGFLRPYLTHHWIGTGLYFTILMGVFAAGYLRYINKVRGELPIHLSKPMARPLRIVAVSDLHLGYFIGKEELGGWIDRINAEKPDMILIAGDIFDNSVRPVEAEQSWKELDRLEAPLGVYACLGNHEYISSREACSALLAKTKVRLLRDESALVDNRLYVVGRDDRMNRQRKTVAQLVGGLDASLPVILLDHQPYQLEDAQQSGVDLQISGHTHRGQVFPFNLIVDYLYECSHGYLKKGNTHYYVSSGLGIWGGKFRIGSQSEYVVIDLS